MQQSTSGICSPPTDLGSIPPYWNVGVACVAATDAVPRNWRRHQKRQGISLSGCQTLLEKNMWKRRIEGINALGEHRGGQERLESKLHPTESTGSCISGDQAWRSACLVSVPLYPSQRFRPSSEERSTR
jgi:hypothetical protein